MPECWPYFFFECLINIFAPDSVSVDTHAKKNLANIQLIFTLCEHNYTDCPSFYLVQCLKRHHKRTSNPP